MKRIALIIVVMVGGLGTGAVLAAPSGVNRVMVAKGTTGDVNIEAKGPVQVTHGIASVDPGGTTGWISWPGPLVATVKAGELTYRNASEDDCAARTWAAGESIVVQGGTVFEVVNGGTDGAEVHVTAFLPPGQKLRSEEQPAGC